MNEAVRGSCIALGPRCGRSFANDGLMQPRAATNRRELRSPCRPTRQHRIAASEEPPCQAPAEAEGEFSSPGAFSPSPSPLTLTLQSVSVNRRLMAAGGDRVVLGSRVDVPALPHRGPCIAGTGISPDLAAIS